MYIVYFVRSIFYNTEINYSINIVNIAHVLRLFNDDHITQHHVTQKAHTSQRRRMSLTSLMEHFLPQSLNEFETGFVRELYEKVTEKKIDNWQVMQAVSRVCGNKTGEKKRCYFRYLLVIRVA